MDHQRRRLPDYLVTGQLRVLGAFGKARNRGLWAPTSKHLTRNPPQNPLCVKLETQTQHSKVVYSKAHQRWGPLGFTQSFGNLAELLAVEAILRHLAPLENMVGQVVVGSARQSPAPPVCPRDRTQPVLG